MEILKQIPFNPKQAVIFDIDDTLIDSKTHTLITPVYQLYKYCQNKGYNIYIITARPRIPYGVQLTLNQQSAVIVPLNIVSQIIKHTVFIPQH